MFFKVVWPSGVLLLLVNGIDSSPPCHHYGHYGCLDSHTFLPAPPGHAPPCAKHGSTFCEHVENYPTNVIHYLLERWPHSDLAPFFASERPIYGPVKPSTGGNHYPYPSSNRPHKHHPPPHSVQQAYHFNSLNQSQRLYPDRRYTLGNPNLQHLSTDPGFIYSAIIHPELASEVSFQEPHFWWKRNNLTQQYTRSIRKKRNEEPLKRDKRQAPPVTLCPTTSQFIAPRAALNSKGNWMYVVNLEQDQRYTQLVRSETCVSNECNGICSLPNGYTSRCEQQYVQKRLIALDGGGQNLYTDLFWLPHCCICQITLSNG